MKLEIEQADLLVLYRHAKALAGALEKLIKSRMLIRCTKCNQPHMPGSCPQAKTVVIHKNDLTNS